MTKKIIQKINFMLTNSEQILAGPFFLIFQNILFDVLLFSFNLTFINPFDHFEQK